MGSAEAWCMTLIEDTAAAVREASRHVLHQPRPTSFDEIIIGVRANEVAVTEVLRPALAAMLPGATWDVDEHASGLMPDGDRWVVDPIGGNVNLVHGMPDWNIGVSLVRDNRPVLAAIYAPVADEMFTAVAGEGALLNGVPLRVSEKKELAGALASTSQAKPGRDEVAAWWVGATIEAMTGAALYVRSSVPVGHQLNQVAAGRTDLHWQYDNLRAHIAPLLIVREAGGVVTHLDGRPWEIAGGGYLAAAPGLHAAALAVLRKVS